MPLIHIKSGKLSKDQKKNIGDRIFDAFHREGIPASTVVILFAKEDEDILMEGGFLIEQGQQAAEQQAAKPSPLPPPPPPEPEVRPDFKSKLRRSKVELNDLKAQLVKTLQLQGALSSFQAQEELGLKTCDWAPATLWRFFSELEDEGVISKQGQKRGTRYVWKGITSQSTHAAPMARLVKRAEEEPATGNS